MTRITAAVAAAACSVSCAAPPREQLVGRYGASVESASEAWRLDDDGKCRVERSGAPPRDCEWVHTERDGRQVIVVTFEGGGPGARATTRYVLTPTRWLGGQVSIPLPSGAVLRKIE